MPARAPSEKRDSSASRTERLRDRAKGGKAEPLHAVEDDESADNKVSEASGGSSQFGQKSRRECGCSTDRSEERCWNAR